MCDGGKDDSLISRAKTIIMFLLLSVVCASGKDIQWKSEVYTIFFSFLLSCVVWQGGLYVGR